MPVVPEKHSVPRLTPTSLSGHESMALASLPKEACCSDPESRTQKDVAVAPSR